jgi:DNA repair exonuclease SbcCD ATPase subunit
MLEKIHLKNFRQHEDLVVDLQPGMTVIRGSNEAGKSTVLEAIAYALFGVKALRNSLDDVVTWGHDTKSLKVELTFNLDGVVFTLRRSKAGAELTYDGGSVTGQTEVTTYVANLFKVDAAAAARLTMANQNEIRGALEAGPKATAELIEKLAEFSQLDDLLELMQEKLTLGSPAVAEANLAAARQTLEASRDLAVPVDENGMQQRILEANDRVSAGVIAVERASSAEDAATEALSKAREKVAARAALETSTDAAVARVVRLRDQLSNIKKVPVPEGVDEQVDALQTEQEAERRASALRVLHKKVEAYTVAGAGRLKGPLSTLEASLHADGQEMQTRRDQIARAEGDVRLYTAELTHGSCTFCGKDLSAVPEVLAKNAATQQKLDQAKTDIETYRSRLLEVSARIDRLATTVRASSEPLRLAAENPDNVKLLDGLLPPVLVWTGPDTTPPEVSVDYAAEIKRLRDSVRLANEANTRHDELSAQHAAASAEANRLKLELEQFPEVNVDAERAAVTACREATSAARDTLAAAREVANSAKRAKEDAVAAFQRAKDAVAKAEADIVRHEEALKTLEFNNALLKKVRAARPVITDKLWNIVLSAVSNYFSEIRGVKSRVTKDSEGFKVDGHAVASMSGSTMDALGLAIRVALVRTFLPSSPFMLLDEPGHGMDDDRTGNMLGFLAGVGAKQILLVTHEDVSQAVADHIITL